MKTILITGASSGIGKETAKARASSKVPARPLIWVEKTFLFQVVYNTKQSGPTSSVLTRPQSPSNALRISQRP